MRDIVLLTLHRFGSQLKDVLSKEIQQEVDSTIAQQKKYLECIKAANIYIIPDGELEHYFVASSIDFLDISNKDKLFHAERDHILNIDSQEKLCSEYAKLIPLLQEAIPHVNVDILAHLKYNLIEWIQAVQTAIVRGEVKNLETLKSNAKS